MTSGNQRLALKANPRELFGKKAKKLRQKGLIPATVYGHNISPVSVELGYKDLSKVYEKSGEAELLDLEILGEKEKRPVLIHQEQKDPVTGKLIHLEFLQVSLTEKVTAKIPLVFVGEARAVKDGIGVLVEVLHEVELEALPQDLPGSLEVRVSELAELNQSIKVSDLVLPQGVKIKTHAEEIVCKIVEPQKEEEKPVAPVTTEGATTTAPAEGATEAKGTTESAATPEKTKEKEKK